MRTVIDVSDEIIQLLDKVSLSERRSRAALIREALADYLRLKSVPPAEAAFGLWGQRERDGVQYQNDLRDEWAS